MKANSSKTNVVVAIVPRERFSINPICVEYVLAFTKEPSQILVFDSNGPQIIKKQLIELERKYKNIRVIRSDHFVYPYEERNKLLELIDDSVEWVAFLDNDAKVSPDWLTWMLNAAQETRSKIVHPLYLIEEKHRTTIHMADGLLAQVGKNGKESIKPIMRYCAQDLANIQKFERMESGFLEFHSCLVHASVLKKLGTFDPIMLAEDVNFSFRVKGLGEKIIFEPRSIVTYVAGPPFESYDLPYFKFRWDEKRCLESIDFLTKKWPLVARDYWDEKLRWAAYHRSRVNPWFSASLSLRRKISHLREGLQKRLMAGKA